MIVAFYRVAQTIVRLILLLLFYPKVIGEEKMPKEGPVVVCANHQSMLDPVFLGIYTKRPIHFMAKKQLFTNKLFAAVLRKVGVFPVDREGTDIRALKTALNILKDRKVLGLFPEGTRVESVDINHFKEGASVIAMRAKAPVMPIRVYSSYKPFTRVRIEFRDLIYPEELIKGLSKEDATHRVTKEIFESIYKEEVAIGNNHCG